MDNLETYCENEGLPRWSVKELLSIGTEAQPDRELFPDLELTQAQREHLERLRNLEEGNNGRI